MKKLISASIMSTLTVMAASACRWQYRRFQESTEKWRRIDEQFRKGYVPKQVDVSDVLNLNCDEWQYSMVSTSGRLGKRFYKVWRYKEGRPGIILIGILQNNQNDCIVVDLGWIPETHMNFQESLEGKSLSLRAMVRKPEFEDRVARSAEMKTFIDLKAIAEDSKLEERCTRLYLERVGEEDKAGGLFEGEEMSLYPFPTFQSSMSKPYLTPDKHQGYCMFWGSCTLLGLYSLRKISRL